jgi:hypothetical protein
MLSFHIGPSQISLENSIGKVVYRIFTEITTRAIKLKINVLAVKIILVFWLE